MSYLYGTGANANYSGRVIVYADQVPYDTDVLRSNQYRQADISALAQTILGLPQTIGNSFTSFASGICVAQSSPDMTVEIGVCAIYKLSQMEPIAYGNLGPLPTPLIYKQFLNMISFASSAIGTITPPSTGNWQYYLVQGMPQTVQINTVNRPYYNPSNPPAPVFAAAPDTEIDNIVFTLVAGAESSKSGALPALPTVGAGNVGMFLILVSDNTTTIVNNLISPFPVSAIPYTLPALPNAIQTEKFTFNNDVGTANAYAAIQHPIVNSLVAGQLASILVANTNTTASTFSLNGLGTPAIVLGNGDPLIGGEMPAGGISDLKYNGTTWQLMNPFDAQATYSPQITVLTGSSGTYTTPANATRLYMKGAAPGGGSSGGGFTNPSGGNGGNVTIAGIMAIGGIGGSGALGAAGGTCSGATINYSGINGGDGVSASSLAITCLGGPGGGSIMFGGGANPKSVGISGVPATGGGAAGGSINNSGGNVQGGGGGGGGGSFEHWINSPAASYAWTIGSPGTAGAAPVGGNAGAVGATGIIIVIAYFD